MKLLKIRFTAKIYEQKILITTLFIKKRIGLEVHEKIWTNQMVLRKKAINMKIHIFIPFIGRLYTGKTNL